MNSSKDKNRVSVSVIIPAKNEEETIENTLSEIFKQDGNNFNLEKVLVFLDGSEDKTPQMVDNFINKNKELINIIELQKSDKSIGISPFVKKVFNNSDSDLIIRIDADTVRLSNGMFEEMVREYEKGNMVIGVKYEHLIIKEFGKRDSLIIKILRKADALGFDTWSQAKYSAENNGVYSKTYQIIGSCFALGKAAYSQIQMVDNENIEEDTFITISALEKNHKITSIKDKKAMTQEKIISVDQLIKRYSRHISQRYRKYYNEKWLEENRPSLKWYFIKSIINNLFKYHIYLISFCTLVLLSFVYKKFRSEDQRW